MGQTKKQLKTAARKLGVDPELPYNDLRKAVSAAKKEKAAEKPKPAAKPKAAPKPKPKPDVPTMFHSDLIPEGGASVKTATTKRDWIPAEKQRKETGHFPCQFCAFVAETEAKLTAHVKKIH